MAAAVLVYVAATATLAAAQAPTLRRLDRDLVELVVSSVAAAADDENGTARTVTTHGRWDGARWGRGGFPSGAYADGVDASGPWRHLDPLEAFRPPHLDAFRARCAPASAARRLDSKLALAAVYASLRAEVANGTEARTATLVLKEAALRGSVYYAALGTAPSMNAPDGVTVELHAAIRDRSRGALVYLVKNRGRARDVALDLRVPSALSPLLSESTVDGAPLGTALRFEAAVGAPSPSNAHRFVGDLHLGDGGEAVVSIAYRAAYLAFDDWPPDQYRGVDVPAGVAAYDGGTLAFSDAALVQLPEVDLSMPFNVVTLQSTIIALYVGTVAAALVRRSSLGAR